MSTADKNPYLRRLDKIGGQKYSRWGSPKPNRPRRPGSPSRRSPFILAALGLTLLAASAAWFASHPTDLARVLERVWPVEPRVKYLTVNLNGKEKRLRPEQFLHFHPGDAFRVVSFTSNRWYNYDLRLYSTDLDLYVVRDAVPLLRVLGEKAFYKPRQFTIQVKKDQRVIANFYLISSLTALDWSAKAELARAPAQKVHYYRLAVSLEPQNRQIQGKLAEWLQKAGDNLAAAEIYEKIYRDSQDPAVLKNLMSVYRAAGDQDKLIQTYQRLITTASKNEALEYLKELLPLYKAGGDKQGLVVTYNRLIAQLPQTEAAAYLRELLSFNKSEGDKKNLVETYNRLISSLSGAETAGLLRELL
ncbi:MAG: hypothetical protein V1742_09930, partial [Pseudomonadota bacterium]